MCVKRGPGVAHGLVLLMFAEGSLPVVRDWLECKMYSLDYKQKHKVGGHLVDTRDAIMVKSPTGQVECKNNPCAISKAANQRKGSSKASRLNQLVLLATTQLALLMHEICADRLFHVCRHLRDIVHMSVKRAAEYASLVHEAQRHTSRMSCVKWSERRLIGAHIADQVCI